MSEEQDLKLGGKPPELNKDNKKVSEKEIEDVEKEILAKQKLADDKKAKEMSELLDKAVKDGKETALKEFEEKQRWEKVEADKAQLEAQLKILQEQSVKNTDDLKKEILEQVKLDSETKKRGVSKNESPFNNKGERVDVDKYVDSLNKEEVDDASGEAFFGKAEWAAIKRKV